MIREIDEAKKNYLIWLTRTEQTDETIIAQVNAECKQWKAKGYQPAVYKSGKEDLRPSVLQLLRRNQKSQAKKELTQEGKLSNLMDMGR